MQGDSLYRVRHVTVSGSASPEGTEKFNRYLAENRAKTLFDQFRDYSKITDADKTFLYFEKDWDLVLELALDDKHIPYYDDTIILLNLLAYEKRITSKEPAVTLRSLQQLHGGLPYNYIYKYIFPRTRRSEIEFEYSRRFSPALAAATIERQVASHIDSLGLVDMSFDAHRALEAHKNAEEKSPFYMALRTNIIYDVLALPNLGIDFYLGKGWTLGGNGMYAWWKDDDKKKMWRAYGAELNLRWYPRHHTKRETPFSSHHLGIYAQLYTYDFGWKKKGELGGKPEGRLIDSPFWAAGIEYGYSAALGSRLSLDFSIGVGYTTGKYHKYDPDKIPPGEIHYVWEGTQRRHFIGPTKAEMALVWLIGRGNTNKKLKKNATKRMADEGGDYE